MHLEDENFSDGRKQNKHCGLKEQRLQKDGARQRECLLFEGRQAVQEGWMSVSQGTMVISKKVVWKT